MPDFSQDLPGVRFAGVRPESPAAKAGLWVADVIVSLGGRPVASIEALRDQLDAGPVGSRLALRVARGGQAVELLVEVAERPGRRCD